MDVATSAGAFTRLMIPGFHSSHIRGGTRLPMMNRLIGGALRRDRAHLSSPRSSASIDLARGHHEPALPGQPSMPKNADPASWPFVYDRAAYEASRVGREMVTVVRPGRPCAGCGSPVESLRSSPSRGDRIVVREQIEFRWSSTGQDFATATTRAGDLQPVLRAGTEHDGRLPVAAR